MSTAIDIVRNLQSRGIEMAIEGESIRMRGHGAPLTEAEREALSRCKGEVIAFLQARSVTEPEQFQNPKNSAKPEVSNYPYGTSPGGRPITHTGKVVSLDAWRQLSDWEKHGPNGDCWDGRTREWEGKK